jgi:hypothetical protein
MQEVGPKGPGQGRSGMIVSTIQWQTTRCVISTKPYDSAGT